MVSPGYSYAAAPDQEHFLAKQRTREFFRRVFARPGTRRWRFNQSPLFLEFLTGARDYDCTPWGIPTYSIFGWQRPCYLLQEGYAQSFRELIDETRWEDYGPRSGNPEVPGLHGAQRLRGERRDRRLLVAARHARDDPRAVLRPARAEAVGATRSRRRRRRRPRRSYPRRGLEAEASPDALRAAFDYRGDVTLTLDDGSALEGYVADPGPERVRVWPRDGSALIVVEAARVRRVALTGRDPAASAHAQGLSPSS